MSRRPATVKARATGRCRYDRCTHRAIDRGDSIVIVAAKWYHPGCWRQMCTPAEADRLVRDVQANTARQRIDTAIATADSHAAAARLTAKTRRRMRLKAYSEAVDAETRRTIAFYGLGNGPE